MQLHTVLDEMILGGQVIETSSEEIMRSVEDIVRFLLPRSFLPSPSHVPFLFFSAILTVLLATWHRMEKQSSTTSLIPKSISQRFSRWFFPVIFRTEFVGPYQKKSDWCSNLSLVACQFSEVLSICYSTWKLIGWHTYLTVSHPRVVSCNQKCDARHACCICRKTLFLSGDIWMQCYMLFFWCLTLFSIGNMFLSLN
jgi:hypothetical protein